MRGFLYVPSKGAYIKFENDRGQLIDIQPQEQKSANYSPLELRGRFEPLMVYEGSSEKSVSFDMRLYFLDGEELENTVDKIRSLVYPVRKGKLHLPPPVVIFVWGKTIKFRGVVQDFGVSYADSVYDVKKGYAYTAQVSLTLIEQRDKPAHFDKVWEGSA